MKSQYSVDLGALAMAIQLAALMDKMGRTGDPADCAPELDDVTLGCPDACHQCTADWLRLRVHREMDKQAAYQAQLVAQLNACFGRNG